MPMRLQELHPSLVHFPITLFPIAIGADLLGRLTGSRALMDLGRRLMPVAVVTAATAGVAGLIAQEEVKAEGDALDILITHRNLNLGLVAAGAGLAAWRARSEQPSAAYLALGLGALATMTYSAYLGGHMVYHHGVGVAAADGVREGAPELAPGHLREVGTRSVADIERGIQHVVEETKEGKLAPAFARSAHEHVESQPQPETGTGTGAGA